MTTNSANSRILTAAMRKCGGTAGSYSVLYLALLAGVLFFPEDLEAEPDAVFFFAPETACSARLAVFFSAIISSPYTSFQ